MRVLILSLLTAAAIGCGEVGEEAIDMHGCPTQAADWTGTAVLIGDGCEGAPNAVSISNAVWGPGGTPTAGKPVLSWPGYDANADVCHTDAAVLVSCGVAGYNLRIPPRR